MEEAKTYKNINISEPEDGVLEIEGEIKADVLEEHKDKVLDEIQEEFEADGFRKGNVPKDVIEERVGEEHILNEAAQSALDEAYSQIVREHDLDIMSRPRVNITKLAAGNPLGFKINVGTVPEMDLPDYWEIAEDVRESRDETPDEVSSEEVDKVMKYVQAQHAQQQGEDGGSQIATPGNDAQAGQVPELTDEFVQQMGDFENVAEFRKKIKQNLQQEKETQEKRKTRDEIMKRLIEETDIDVPEITIETQLQSRLERLKQSLEEKDSSMEDYLDNIDKTEEEFIEEQKQALEKQIKSKLIIEAIADEEDVEIDEDELERQVNMLRMRDPEADLEVIKAQAEKSLQNEEVLKMLDGTAGEEEEGEAGGQDSPIVTP
ncbi:MAG: trigger factor [Candidatus Magasanikbacteria bacterium]